LSDPLSLALRKSIDARSKDNRLTICEFFNSF
jgi:hypothetical protein